MKEYFKNNFYDKSGRVKGKSLSWLKKNHKDFLEKLFSKEPRLNQDNLKLKHIEYFLFHNYSYNDLKCKICDKLKALKYGKNREPFKLTCLAHSNEAKQLQYKKISKIQKEKMQNKDFKQKLLQKRGNTNIKKYGTSNPMQNEEIKNKAIQTQIKKYGDIIFKAKKEEIKSKWIEKYKASNPMQNEEIKNKAIQTQIKKYGDIIFKAKKEEIKNINLKKYGVFYPIQNEEIKEKIKLKMMQNYNVFWPAQKHLKNINKLDKEFIEENFFNEKKEFLRDKFRDFYGYAEARPYQILKELNIDYKHRSGTSQYEDQIVEFIKSINPNLDIIRNSRKII